MFRNLIRVLALLLVFSAGPAFALKYDPVAWPLRDGLIPPFDMAGTIEVVNAQPSTDEAVVYKYGVSMKSNYNAITAVMAQQIRDEIAKNGRASEGAAKRIEIKVVHLLSKYKFFYWNSVIRFEVALGNGATISKEVPHGSGNVHQDLNGCIAEGVMVLLNDQQVRDYLSQKVADTTTPEADSAVSDTTATPTPPQQPSDRR